jgi:hypothetical protein
LDQLLNALTDLANIDSLQIVAIVAAVGTISMAILQVAKEFVPIRKSYNAHWIKEWFKLRTRSDIDLPGHQSQFLSPEDNLVAVAVGSDPAILYELDVDDLVAQLREARTIILNYPIQNFPLFVALCPGASQEDINRFLLYHAVAASAATQKQASTDDLPMFPQAERDRLAAQISANISALGLALNHDWRYRMQLLAMIITTVLMVGAVAFKTKSLEACALAVPLGIIGSYFAPIARDLIAALQRLRAN